MKIFQVTIVLAIWLGANVINAQEPRCIQAGVGDHALQCTDGRGHSWYADINGVPAGTQHRQPPTYANPAGSALSGQRAAMEDAAMLQQIREQQAQQAENAAINQQFDDPRFQADGKQCAKAAGALYPDQSSRMSYYDFCMTQKGWRKPGR